MVDTNDGISNLPYPRNGLRNHHVIFHYLLENYQEGSNCLSKILLEVFEKLSSFLKISKSFVYFRNLFSDSLWLNVPCHFHLLDGFLWTFFVIHFM